MDTYGGLLNNITWFDDCCCHLKHEIYLGIFLRIKGINKFNQSNINGKVATATVMPM